MMTLRRICLLQGFLGVGFVLGYLAFSWKSSSIAGIMEVSFGAIESKIDHKFCKDWDLAACNYPPLFYRPALNKSAIRQAKLVNQKLRQGVAAVIVYNWDDVINAPLLFNLYRRFFADVRFCSPMDKVDFAKSITSAWGKEMADALEPIYVDMTDGMSQRVATNIIAYYCVNSALKAIEQSRPDLRVDGIFFIQDDALLNIWHIWSQMPDLTNSYIMPWFNVYDIDKLLGCGPHRKWRWREEGAITAECNVSPIYKRAKEFNGFLLEWYKHWENSSDANLARCWKNKAKVTRADRRVVMSLIDVFYLSRRHFGVILPMFELARQNWVFQEQAVSTSLYSCLPPESLSFISTEGYVRFKLGGRKLWDCYDAKNNLYGHPFKLHRYVTERLAGNHTAKRFHDHCLFCLFSHHLKDLERDLNAVR